MELIERYVQAVTERLPESTRDDVARELRANIEDMLPDDARERDVRAVLEKMGSPVALANEYRQSKRYLIGPAMYDAYVDVLKIVLCIAPVVLAFLGLAGVALESSGGSYLDYVVAFVGGAFQGAVYAFIWVTLVFAILERAGVDERNLMPKKKEWSVEDLPPVAQSSKSRIDRAGEVVSIILTVAFVSIIVLKPDLFGSWEQMDGAWQVAPVFDLARLETYLPAMVSLAVIGFGLSVYKIVVGRWTMPLAAANTLFNLAMAVVACLAITDSGLWNSEITLRMEEVLEVTAGSLDAILGGIAMAAVIVIVIMCVIDSAMGFLKSKDIRLFDIPDKIIGWMGAER